MRIRDAVRGFLFLMRLPRTTRPQNYERNAPLMLRRTSPSPAKSVTDRDYSEKAFRMSEEPITIFWWTITVRFTVPSAHRSERIRRRSPMPATASKRFRQCDERQPDVIPMDVVMPEMNGNK